jgi:multidrug efflux system membrane fusion protein
MAVGLTVTGCEPAGPTVAETQAPPVSVSQPLVKKVTDFDPYEGRITAAQTVEIRARVRGHLTKVAFKEGQMVKENELLFEIDPRSYQAAVDGAKAQVTAAEAANKLAKAELARVQTLIASRAATPEERDVWTAKVATTAADILKATAELEKAQLDLDFTKVTAPLAGKISRAQVDVGNLINSGGGETLLATIVSVNPMYVYFTVDEKSVQRYRKMYNKGGGEPPPLESLKIPVEVGLEGEDGYPHKGVIDYADPQIQKGTGTLQVRGVLANDQAQFVDGLRARVQVPSGDPYEATLITERAIGTEQGRKYVFVVNKETGVAERRDIVLDRRAEGLQGVRQGLKAGQWVVVNGIQRVRDGMKVTPRDVAMPDTTPAAATPTNPKN